MTTFDDWLRACGATARRSGPRWRDARGAVGRAWLDAMAPVGAADAGTSRGLAIELRGMPQGATAERGPVEGPRDGHESTLVFADLVATTRMVGGATVLAPVAAARPGSRGETMAALMAPSGDPWCDPASGPAERTPTCRGRVGGTPGELLGLLGDVLATSRDGRVAGMSLRVTASDRHGGLADVVGLLRGGPGMESATLLHPRDEALAEALVTAFAPVGWAWRWTGPGRNRESDWTPVASRWTVGHPCTASATVRAAGEGGRRAASARLAAWAAEHAPALPRVP